MSNQERRAIKVEFFAVVDPDATRWSDAFMGEELKRLFGYSEIGHVTVTAADPAEVRPHGEMAVTSEGPPCLGKSFLHHHDLRSVTDVAELIGIPFTAPASPWNERWVCLTCRDTGRYIDFYGNIPNWLYDVRVTLDRLAEHGLQDGAVVLFPSDAPPERIGETFDCPLWRVPGIDRVMVAIPARSPVLERIVNGTGG